MQSLLRAPDYPRFSERPPTNHGLENAWLVRPAIGIEFQF
jgi:hypothetical protein